MVQALEDWNMQFGAEDFTQPSKGGNNSSFPLEFEKNYPVRVKRARLSTSTRGSRQLELEVAILDRDGEEAGIRKEWLTLPKQPTTDVGQPAENVLKWTMRRRDDLGKVLAGADSRKYGLYAQRKRDDNAKVNIYIDHDGNIMSKEALDERGRFINKNIMDCADAMHEALAAGDTQDLDPVIGAEFFIVKVENPKNEKYPYTNVYSAPDTRKRMWYEE